MTQKITFENTLLKGSGKRGILKPIESTPGGDYYLLQAGGFNIENRTGITYAMNDYLRACMGPNSELNRRVDNGQVYAELGHPTPYYFENVNGRIVRTKITELFEWVNRLKTILDDRVCGHIRKIIWEATQGLEGPVYNSIEICPFGTYGYVLDTSLKNPDINTAVSIRTVTQPQRFGDKVRQVEHFSTYDVVLEQGMLRACKHLSSGLEGFLDSVPSNEDQYGITATFDEFISLAETHLNSEELHYRLAGNEALDRVRSLVNELKASNSFKKPVSMIRSNSLGAFL